MRNPLGWTRQPSSRERKLDLQHFRRHILRYWPDTPTQHPAGKPPVPTDAHRRRATGTLTVTRPVFPRPWLHLGLRRPLVSHLQRRHTPFRGTRVVQSADGLWRLGKIVHRARSNPSPIPFTSSASSTTRGRSKSTSSRRDTQPTARDADYGSWCLQHHRTGSLARGISRNSDGLAELPPLPLPPLGSLAIAAESSCFFLSSFWAKAMIGGGNVASSYPCWLFFTNHQW